MSPPINSIKNILTWTLRNIACSTHLTCKMYHPSSIEIGSLMRTIFKLLYCGFFCFWLFFCLFLSHLRCPNICKPWQSSLQQICLLPQGRCIRKKNFFYRLGMELRNCTERPLYAECVSWKNTSVACHLTYHSSRITSFCLCVLWEGRLSFAVIIHGRGFLVSPVIFKWILFAISGVCHSIFFELSPSNLPASLLWPLVCAMGWITSP